MIKRILLKFKVLKLRLGIWRFKIGRSGFFILRSEAAEEDLGTNRSEVLSQKKGFTLIETIILIVMAGILLPAIVVPFATGIRGSGKPEVVTTAMYLAHQKMEEFMKYDYSISYLNTTTSHPTSYVDVDAVRFPNYQWQWDIVFVKQSDLNPPSSDVGYKKILVRVKDPQNDTYVINAVVTNFP